MQIAILHNSDHDVLLDDPGREARRDVMRVAALLADALAQEGLDPYLLSVDGRQLEFFETLSEQKPDLVVNLCESLAADSRGEMAVPCLLELLDIPYTSSSALSLGMALHKNKAKELLRARGIPTPEFRVIERLEDLVTVDIPFPLIVKPAREDASVGVDFDSVVADRPSLGKAASEVLHTFEQAALVERFIPGREIYVPLLGNHPRRALPLSEISFGPYFSEKPHIVSYRAKWEAESEDCKDSPSVPCALDGATEERLVGLAMSAFEALECRDYGRVDFRLTDEGEPYVIDINPNCDLHPDAGFAKAAANAGIDYRALAVRLVEIGLERHHGNTSHRRAGSPTALRAVGTNRNVLSGRGGMRPRAHRTRARAE
jgi:D-alanine-D-alanine ligase